MVVVEAPWRGRGGERKGENGEMGWEMGWENEHA